MDKVYLVWAGEYSEADVKEVFSTREMAEEYARLRNERECRENFFVEEWDVVDDLAQSFYPDSFSKKIVTYDYNKNKILDVKQFRNLIRDPDIESYEEEIDGIYHFCLFRSYREDIRNPITDDRLLKIAQDRWAQFKARMEGIG